MERIPIGQFIRERRVEKGMTQEELCDGACDVATLSRIENGRIIPRNLTLHILLERLGVPDTYYTVPMDEYENRIRPLQKEARARVIAFGRADRVDRATRREEALAVLQELEGVVEENDHATRQNILRNRAILGTPEGSYPPAEQREMLLEALRLTAPGFEISKIDNFRYTQEETGLINQIAITYIMEGNRETAISIYRQILAYIQENNQQLSRCAGQLIMVTYNLSRELTAACHYEEAAHTAEIGRKACVKYGNYESLPQLLALLANCHAHLGHRQESERLYWQAYHVYVAFENAEGLIHLKNDANDTLGIQIPGVTP